jgi:hypothetical protein
MRYAIHGLLALAYVFGLGWGPASWGGERTQRFDQDPGWEGRNNRSNRIPARAIRQDFGFSPKTRHAGGQAVGEVGGMITPAAEPAYYAKRIAPRALRDRLTASGKLACGGGPVHALVGFFNAATVNEWRTPNTIVLRIQGRGDRFFAYVEYATSRWRACGDEPRPFARRRDPRSGKLEPRGFTAGGAVHTWSLSYDPDAASGRGAIAATIDGETSVCELATGHQADGATFDRFGVLSVSKSADSPGELWLDDLDVNGTVEDFATDPNWEGRGNRLTFRTTNIRPRFDFGFSTTHFAGGAAAGELGGLIFRGDIRDRDRIACYGDRVVPLTLDRPLRASGAIALRRAVSDSTTLLGFYHSRISLAASPSQASGFPEHFLGIAVEGPSREGFFVYPAYRVTGDRQGAADGPARPHILPDGAPHHWDFAYQPPAAKRRGRITLTLGGHTTQVDLRLEDHPSGDVFDRFGIVTTWIDGNGQSVYFDDLTYTSTQHDGAR